MSDDDTPIIEDEDIWQWPDNLGEDSDCGEHCTELTLLEDGKPTRIIERHCNCPWCHGEDQG